MNINSFLNTLDHYINELSHYSFPQLLLKPSPSSWSLGQLYMHLIVNTDWFFEQAKTCATHNYNSTREASREGKEMLGNNAFPDMQLQGPPDNDHTPQPISKKQILQELKRQKEEISKIAGLITNTKFKGKIKHPGLHYFNAAEWFQFAEMHLRHHLRQKKRIDEFLESQL